MMAEIEIYDHTGEEADKDRLDWFEERLRDALPRCLASPGTESPVLPALESIEISIISDAAIAEVHGQFMDDPTPTDVITFHHGEILVSRDTAEREGPAHGHSESEELLLYMIHGLLHLNGHVDAESAERDEMHRQQNRILREVLTAL